MEAVEAAADADLSMTITVAAVQAALNAGMEEERAVAARMATKSSRAAIAAARRAIRTAGDAMGVDLPRYQGVDLRAKPIVVKHCPDAPPITDLNRTATVGAIGDGQGTDTVGTNMEGLAPPPRLPARLKRGKRKNGGDGLGRGLITLRLWHRGWRDGMT